MSASGLTVPLIQGVYVVGTFIRHLLSDLAAGAHWPPFKESVRLKLLWIPFCLADYRPHAPVGVTTLPGQAGWRSRSSLSIRFAGIFFRLVNF